MTQSGVRIHSIVHTWNLPFARTICHWVISVGWFWGWNIEIFNLLSPRTKVSYPGRIFS